jgi:CheY-like chemotaxis protein
MKRKQTCDYSTFQKNTPSNGICAKVPFQVTTENYSLRGFLTGVEKKEGAETADSPLVELEKLNRLSLLTRAARALSHDLNNQLSAVAGNLDLAFRGYEIDDEIGGLMRIAHSAAEKSMELARNIHMALRGGLRLKEKINVAELIDMIGVRATAYPSVKLNSACEENLPSAEADLAYLSEAFENIVQHASESIGENGRINIKVEKVDVDENSNLPLEHGQYILISIADDGKGMENNQLSSLMMGAYQSEPNSDCHELAVANSIIQLNGGFMHIESLPDAGTIVYVYLKAAAEEVPQKTKKEKPKKGHGKILFMDDRNEVRNVVCNILNKLGYESECAEHGYEAIEKYKRAYNSDHPYDAVILDLNIPEGLGAEETIRELRRFDPKVKALVCSGYHNSHIMTNHEKFGFSGYVTKPFTVNELSRIVHETINQEKNADRPYRISEPVQ